ncbi:MAG: alpha-galactosidase, partial [Sedimentisphaerales bacterium]|nr:alpha-galactosidase [Sedimentisphaerales bacterium]
TSTCSGTPPTAQSWDAKTAWGSAPPNPNGQWSYKHGWVGNWANCPTYTADTNYQKWKTANTLPWIGKKLRTPYKDRLVMRANTGFTGGSPGPGSCPAIVWTCPATGIYNITGTLQKIASGGDGVEWVIHDGYWTIWASGLFNDTVNHPFTLNGQLIGKGETFYLTFNSRATTTYDETAVDFTFTQVSRAPWAGDFKLHFPKGSDATYMDFEPVDWGLVPSTSYTLKAWGGRSSDTRAVPFFNIEQTDTIGHIVGIGWTGQWKATFTRNSSSNLNLQAGIEDLNAKLNASESIRSAAILLSFWDGNYEQGTSEFRRLLREHYSPTPDGAKVDPPVASSVHGTYGFEATTETNLVDHTDKTATNGLLVDYLWLDAGWYTCPNNNWAEGVGNWDPDPTRFPNGLAPVSSHMHSHGFDFLMWFEPERVMPTTWMYTNHPEWLLTPSSLPEGISYQSTWRLFNLANADALDWLKNKVNTMISTIGIDVYRQDFNMHPLYYWRTGEASDRKGINEIKHITNMYNFLDYLVSQHPSLIEDNCAAGGRRIDFEMLRRCLVLSRSDLFWDAVGEQCATSGLGRWVPYTGTGDVSLNQSTHRSGMGASFSIAYNANDPATWAPANSMLTEYWYVREPMVKGDFYPLSTFDTSNTIWFAYQWNYPEAGKAILQAWRRPSCTETSKTYKLRNLEPGAVYTINDLRGQGTYTLTGMELMTTGITLSNYAAGGSALVVVTK